MAARSARPVSDPRILSPYLSCRVVNQPMRDHRHGRSSAEDPTISSTRSSKSVSTNARNHPRAELRDSDAPRQIEAGSGGRQSQGRARGARSMYVCVKSRILRGLASPEMCIDDMLANDIVAPWTRCLCGRCVWLSKLKNNFLTLITRLGVVLLVQCCLL